MNILEKRTKQEQLLIYILIGSLVFSVYLFFRVKPLNQEKLNTQAEIKQLKKDFNKLFRETKDVKPSHILKQEISSLESKIKKEKESLNGLDVSFVELSDQETVHQVLSRITVLAEQHRLQIIEKTDNLQEELSTLITNSATKRNAVNRNRTSRNRNVAQRKVNPNNISNLAKNNKQLQRHIFNIKLRGSFYSTHQFIKSLNQLEYSVLITRISFKADNEVTYNGRRVINSELTLAI